MFSSALLAALRQFAIAGLAGNHTVAKGTHRDSFTRDISLADVLRHVLVVADHATAGRVLADEVLRFTAARMVVLVQTDAGALAPVVAPDKHRTLLQHQALAVLLHEAGKLETSRFYFSDTVIPGLEAIHSVKNRTNCLAVPLIYGDIRAGTVLLFGLAPGESLDAVTADMEMLAPLLAIVLRNASLQRRIENKDEQRPLQMAMQALDTTRECVYWIDEYGRILYANPATEQELGYTNEELLQMSIPDIDPNMPPELWGPAGELTRRLNVEGLRKFLTYHRRRNGHLVPVEVDADAFHYEGDTYFIAITRDISARLEAEEALRKTEAKFSAMFSLTPEPMVLTRLKDGMVIEASRSFAEHFGDKTVDVIGRSTLPDDLNVWVDAGQRSQWAERLAHDDEVLGFETQLRSKDGSISTVLLSSKILNIGGEKCVLSVVHDITGQKQQAAHLERIAHHDPLTGLPNRLLLGDRLRQAIARNQRGDTVIAVCYLDLDGFKEVNDRFGHQAGDELLIEVANRLIACVRGGDTVARLGGDEFVVLLSGLVGEEECRVALDRLLQAVAAPYVIGGISYSGVTASIGVTLFPNDAVDSDTLMRHADHAMYVAKQAGKNRYQLFDTRLEQRIEARLATLGLLGEAQKSGQFRLYYQPKVDCRQGRIVGLEALIRWQHPTLGLLSPAEFLPLIEDTDLALSIGEWVFREALSQMAQWRREGLNLCISVNAFIRHLLHPGFANTLVSILDQYPELKPNCLTIEIVETAALKEVDAIRQVIEDCRSFGIAFSLDDFGTGYSTLSHLRHLPATEIKIDHSFVRHMLERAEDFAIVEAVIGMGRAFGRSIVAEGAETPAHIIRLLDMGCDVMQGYALARPMVAADIPRWVREFRPDPVWYRQAGNSDKA